jgi:hypothetical protein
MTVTTLEEAMEVMGSETTGWEAGGRHVRAALRGLSKAERRHVKAGYIGGDIRGSTLHSLRLKGMFYHHIDSPNGQCGIMRLTPLGVNVSALLNPVEEDPSQ